ncbi:MAG: hypothetical protein Tsb009_22100 [Planctomycetaceae bacterium]
MRSQLSFCARLMLGGLLASFVFSLPLQMAQAAPTAEQRKELSSIRRDLSKVSLLSRRKKFDEATKIIEDAEKRLDAVMKAAKLTEKDRTVVSLRRAIQLRKSLLEKAIARAGGKKTSTTGVQYDKHIAPILKARCARCHTGNNARGGLRIDQPASVLKTVTAGNARASTLIKRLIAPGNQRMPKNGPALTRLQIQTIALWINQGAKTGQGNANVPRKKPIPKVTIAKATGNEKVSFTKDIAPFMVNLCLNCHNDRRKSGGLSIATFEKMMQGGKSGRVILPGNLDGSRMWDLVGKQQPFKMPRGQALITRTNWRNLKTWIEEGAKFDGDDPKKSLRSLVPTEQEIKAARFAKFSAQEFAQYRRKQAEDAWKKVLPKETPTIVEGKEFFVLGNVPAARLEEINKWGEEHASTLRKLFRDKSSLLFKGKLAIIVMKDRFGYEEFNLVIQKREIPREMKGHSVVDPIFENAYIVLQNIEGDATETSPSMKINLIDHLTGAVMKRQGAKLPDWILRGTGLALAAQSDPKNPYTNSLRAKVPEILRNVQNPEAVFANGTFSPVDVEAVGYTLVEFLIRGGGGAKFGQLIASIQRGSSVAASVKRIYQADLKTLARAYAFQVNKKRKK